MSITSSPSDYALAGTPDYTAGIGFYTDYIQVADLLQVPRFDTTATYPTREQVGNIIKRVEGMVDDKLKRSYRPIITKKEIHNFQYTNRPGMTLYGGYVGFIQLRQMKIQKVVSLQVWSGSGYKELASAQAQIELLDSYRDIHAIILQLPNSSIEFTLLPEGDVANLSSSEFSNTFGVKTTANDIVSLINEEFPSTRQYTNANAKKSLFGTQVSNPSINSNLSVSDFFFAQKEEGNGANILISSLLSGDDGSECLVKIQTQQTCTANLSSANLTVADSSKLAVGMIVQGAGITGSKTISSIADATTVVLDSGSGITDNTGTYTFTAVNSTVPNVVNVVRFTDKEDMKRNGDYWLLGEEGRIFFLQDYPYHTRNSVFVTYVAGNNRVPAAVHEAATKLVAAEIIRHDDQSVLITETGANISTKEKYDILKNEAMAILGSKTDIVYFIDWGVLNESQC